jgi:hypothetical protein
VIFCYSHISFAEGIRTVRVNDKKMQPILLKMGKASVLRFSEKPKKVVIGNQNYYSVEFIDNDLTIQPLGDVETNLFVYTPYRTYGFILRVCHSCQYDDLVYVKWKSKVVSPKRKTKSKAKVFLPVFRSIGLNFSLGKDLSFSVIKTMVDSTRGLRFVDLVIKNVSKKKLMIAGLQIIATRNGKPLPNQGYVIEEDVLQAGKETKARLFLSNKVKRGFSLNGVMEGNKSRVIVGRKFLK